MCYGNLEPSASFLFPYSASTLLSHSPQSLEYFYFEKKKKKGGGGGGDRQGRARGVYAFFFSSLPLLSSNIHVAKVCIIAIYLQYTYYTTTI